MATLFQTVRCGDAALNAANAAVISRGEPLPMLLALWWLVKATRELESSEGSWQWTARRTDSAAIKHTLSHEVRYVVLEPGDMSMGECFEILDERW